MASSQFAADDGRGAGLMSFFGGGVDSAPRPVSYEPVSQANSKAGLSSASSASAASWGQATFPNPEAEDVSVRGFLRLCHVANAHARNGQVGGRREGRPKTAPQ